MMMINEIHEYGKQGNIMKMDQGHMDGCILDTIQL
jgi:hypothetical protein